MLTKSAEARNEQDGVCLELGEQIGKRGFGGDGEVLSGGDFAVAGGALPIYA